MDAKNVGARIAALRKELGLTQKELANKLLVTNKAVSKWETGDGFPDITILPTLAKTLKTSVDFLLADGSANYVARSKPAMQISFAIQLAVFTIAMIFVFLMEDIMRNYIDSATFIFTFGGSLAGAFLMQKLRKSPDFTSSLITYGFPIGCVVGEIYFVYYIYYNSMFIFGFAIMPILYSTIMMLIVYLAMRRKDAKSAYFYLQKENDAESDSVLDQ